MLFDVQDDYGPRITAYIVPDSAGMTPSVRVLSDGSELLKLEANQHIPAIVAAGRHATGQCGFDIDETLIPNLASLTDIEIVDTNTGLLVYRRPPKDAIEGMRMFRLETHLLPLWHLDDALKSRFQSWYKGIDRFGRETSTQVFCFAKSTSSYISGRLLYKNYEYYLRQGIRCITLMRDPYEEIAERLLVLKSIGSKSDEILGERDTLSFAPVMELLSEVPTLDDATCRSLFKKAPKTVLYALASPLVRQLTVSTPDELPGRAAVAVALEVLASFDLVGLRANPDDFVRGLGATLQVEPTGLPFMGEHGKVKELGAVLRSIPVVEAILEQDLELFHLVMTAFDSLDVSVASETRPSPEHV